MSLCKVCDELVISRDQETKDQCLGTWLELTNRSTAGCEACAFFKTILETSGEWSGRLEELQQRVIHLNSLRLDARKPRSGSRRWASDDLLLEICKAENVENDDPEVDSYRPIPVSSQDEKCVDQIKSWYQNCLQHDGCTHFGKVPLPSRVIKVSQTHDEDLRLMETAGQHGEYVTLSHTWGISDISKLTTQNLEQLQQGIDVDSLSQNFLDAIEITRRLGFEYLWIDALCILQDNSADWNREAPRMANIYGLSALTISATAATSTESGIFSDRNVLYSPILGSNKDARLRLQLLSRNHDIEYSPLATRGWAAQERMMSPRVVHFTKRQLIWECASDWSYEASGKPDRQHGSGQVDQEYRKVTFQPFVNEKLITELGRGTLLDKSTKGGNREGDLSRAYKRLKPWLQNVSEYSGRSLTVSSDKLPSMAGMATIIDDGSVGDYFAGIWSQGIGIGLSWARQNDLLKKLAGYRAPSWSWASVDGKISYDIPLCVREPSAEKSQTPKWVEDHQPILIDHKMVLRHPEGRYMHVEKGSYIVLEGDCISREQFNKLLGLGEGGDETNFENYDSDNRNKFFNPLVALDRSSVFDCPCCNQGKDDKPGEHVKSLSDVVSQFMVLYGEKWDHWQGYLTLLMLKESRGDPDAFERSGIVRLSRENGFADSDPENFARALDDLGFERKTLKLI